MEVDECDDIDGADPANTLEVHVKIERREERDVLVHLVSGERRRLPSFDGCVCRETLGSDP